MAKKMSYHDLKQFTIHFKAQTLDLKRTVGLIMTFETLWKKLEKLEKV